MLLGSWGKKFIPLLNATARIPLNTITPTGYLYLQYGQEYRHKINRGYQWALQMGWSGAASQAQRFQNLYHDLVLNLPNLAWVAPQPQLLHAALSGSYYWAERCSPGCWPPTGCTPNWARTGRAQGCILGSFWASMLWCF